MQGYYAVETVFLFKLLHALEDILNKAMCFLENTSKLKELLTKEIIIPTPKRIFVTMIMIMIGGWWCLWWW